MRMGTRRHTTAPLSWSTTRNSTVTCLPTGKKGSMGILRVYRRDWLADTGQLALVKKLQVTEFCPKSYGMGMTPRYAVARVLMLRMARGALKLRCMTASCSCGSTHGGLVHPSMFVLSGRAPLWFTHRLT